MTTKSPTASLKWREMIGEQQFVQRREVFDKYDTVFLPTSPTSAAIPMEDEPSVITSNHAKTTWNLKRSSPAYSSMRVSKTEDNENGFRSRKYSETFGSEINDNDIDFRASLTERTRRLSKLRKDFLASNLHEPVSSNPFARVSTRFSMPVRNGSLNYKIESPNIYKFPFAEPFSTPPPTRKLVVAPETVDDTDEAQKENKDPIRTRHHSTPNHTMFDDLVKRYSPQRKIVDWNLPPTKPRVVGSIAKSTTESFSSSDLAGDKNGASENDVFIDDNLVTVSKVNSTDNSANVSTDTVRNDNDTNGKVHDASRLSIKEINKQDDKVHDLPRVNKEPKPDITIPDLLEKITHDASVTEVHKTNRNVKHKRSILDKLLGRKKNKKEEIKEF